MDARAIPLSRVKLVFLLLGGLVFAAAGAWMLSLEEAEIVELRRLSNPTLFRGIAAVALAGGALCVYFAIRKMFDSRPGLVLSAEGILDNSSGVAAGLIPWADITGFTVYEVHRTKMLIVMVRDNEKYLQRGNPVQRALHRANTRMVGSPIAISSSTLKIGFDELCAEVEAWRARHGAP